MDIGKREYYTIFQSLKRSVESCVCATGETEDLAVENLSKQLEKVKQDCNIILSKVDDIQLEIKKYYEDKEYCGLPFQTPDCKITE